MRDTIRVPARHTPLRWAVLLALLTVAAGCGKTYGPAGTDSAPREKDSSLGKSSRPTTGSTQPGKASPSDSQDRQGSNKQDPPRTPPDFSLTARAFYDEVTDGISVAGKKYGGKVVELTGKVQRLGRNLVDPKGPPSVRLGDSHYTVVCTTVDKQPWLKCVPGQTVKIRGTVNAAQLLATVGMQDCEITSVSGDPALPVSAPDLLKEIAADEKAARKKYDGKVVSLSGWVRSVKKGESSSELLVEMGDGKRSVICRAWSADEPFLKQRTPGKPVRFLGELDLTGDKVELRNALLTQGWGLEE